MSSSVHVDNKEKDILILGFGATQGLGEHSLTAGKCTLSILLKLIQSFVWACIIMEQIVIYLLMVKKFLNATPLCLGNISKDLSVDNMVKTG